jgi:DeoR/GlpR family transcriptional regulator of sugar metabolism
MPKYTRVTRGKIIARLQGQKLITIDDLTDAMEFAEIEHPDTIERYTDSLEKKGFLERVEGGWKLTAKSRDTAVITIRVTPAQNLEDVIRGVKGAVDRFGKIITMEVEA